MNVSQGGLLVGLAIFGVIAYEFRTVLEMVGISVPILLYMTAVFVGAIAVVLYLVMKGELRMGTETNGSA